MDKSGGKFIIACISGKDTTPLELLYNKHKFTDNCVMVFIY